MKYIVITISFLLSWIANISAQEVHSSQFYSVPLLLNPAQTGNSDYNIRGGVNYRNQWNSATTPFVSQTLFIDSKLTTPLISSSWIGLGGIVFNDKAGDGGLKTTRMILSSSINKSLNENNTLFFHVGASIEMVNKSVDYYKLIFDDQWNPSLLNFDSNIDSQELKNANRSLYYSDFAVGTQITYFKSSTRFFLGMSASHIKQPNESFYQVTNNLKQKFTLHGGVEKRLKTKTYICPKFILSTQKGSTEWTLGTNLLTPYKKKIILHYGLWYRFTKDIIPVIGYQKKRLKLLISYDINIAKSGVLNYKRGGLEFSLTYNYNYSSIRDVRKKERKKRSDKLNTKVISCPKFLQED